MARLVTPVLFGPARGHRAKVPIRAAPSMMFGRYERPVARFLQAALRDATVFYDVGAAEGYFSRLALRAMTAGAVFAFEPNPSAARALSRLPVTLVQVAVGRDPGEKVLLLQHGRSARLEDSRASLESSGPPRAYSSIRVPVRTLDSFDFPAPDVVKIDVEGSEIEVLEGGSQILGSARALVVECHSMPILKSVLDFVGDRAFEEIQITAGGNHLGPPIVMARRP